MPSKVCLFLKWFQPEDSNKGAFLSVLLTLTPSWCTLRTVVFVVRLAGMSLGEIVVWCMMYYGVVICVLEFGVFEVNPSFRCGKALESTLSDIESGRVAVGELPMITVIQQGEFMFSMNNRRLWVFKQCRRRGLLKDNVVWSWSCSCSCSC